MRQRLLTPFASAVAGSVLLLLAMFVWSGMRDTGNQSLLLAPTVAEAGTTSANGVTITWSSSAPTVLGDETVFTAVVEITSTTDYTMTWDYNINTPDLNVTTELLTGPITATSGQGGIDLYFYRRPGIYDAVATVFVGGEPVVSDTIQVQVDGPTIDLTTTPATPQFGDAVTFNITVDNFRPNTVREVQLEYGGLGPATDVFTMLMPMTGTNTLMLTGTSVVTLTTSGTFTPTASIIDNDPNDRYILEETDTQEIVVDPQVTLTVDNAVPEVGTAVDFTAEAVGIGTAALAEVADVVFDFGDGTQVADDAAPFTVAKTYTTSGSFTATATLNFRNAVYGGIASSPVTVTVTDGTPSLQVTAPISLTAGQQPGSGVVTATLTTGSGPVEDATVSLAITSDLGARFGDVKVVTGTTSAEGVFTATLTAGPQAGDIAILGTAGAVTTTATVQAVLPDNSVAAEVPPTGGTVEASVNIPGVGPRGFALNLTAQQALPFPLILNITGLSTTGEIAPSTPISPTDPTTPTTTTLNTFLAQAVGTVPAQTANGEVVLYGFDVQIYAPDSPTPLTTEQLVAALQAVTGTATISSIYQDGDLTKTASDGSAVNIIESTVNVRQLDTAPDGFGPMGPGGVSEGSNTVSAQVQQVGVHAVTGSDRARLYLPIVIGPPPTSPATQTLTLR